VSEQEPKRKGTWIFRFTVWFFTVVLAFLVFWLLGFLVQDIRSVEGPQFGDIEKRYVDRALLDKGEDLDKEIADAARQMDQLKEKQNLLGESTRNLQSTINQLLELQRLRIEKALTFPESQQKTFTDSLDLFLENQKRFQSLNNDIAKLADDKASLEAEKRRVEASLEAQRRPAFAEYQKVHRAHDLKLAFFQLLILVPVLILAAVLVAKKHGTAYFPIFLALALSTLVRVSLVIHEYFPSRFFKYVLLLGLLVVVTRLLVHFIRSIAYPRLQELLRQHKEAYRHFLCPICDYPIRRGPLRFAFWNRRSVRSLRISPETTVIDEEYVCPACGTRLFQKCASCHAVRHSLLPYCEHCGKETAGHDEAHPSL
jgi:predicted RNA-binding Zn-ribbon protein involved in translation (DUF1610 family)